MPTLFKKNEASTRTTNIAAAVDSNNGDNHLFISHITIYRSGVILAAYLIGLEIIFLVINLLIRLPLSFFIAAIGANTLYSINTLIYIGLIVIKLFFMMIIIFQWLENYYEIKPGKVIYKEGLLKRQDKEFYCPDISKIQLSQGLWGRLFNFGTITLYVKPANDSFSLSNIPNPYRNLKLIEKSLGSKHIEITMTDEAIEDEK